MRSNPNAIIADLIGSAATHRLLCAGLHHGKAARARRISLARNALETARYVRQQRQREADNYDEDHFGFGWLADREYSIHRRLHGPVSMVPPIFSQSLFHKFIHGGMLIRLNPDA